MKLLTIALLLIPLLVLPAEAQAQVEFSACRTIYDSLHTDWRATTALYDAGLGRYEGNPVIRAIGPAPYFGTIMLAVTSLCRETPGWRVLSLGVFAVQTWAVNTHTRSPFGHYTGPPPMLYFAVRW